VCDGNSTGDNWDRLRGSAADRRRFVCCSSWAFSNEATFAESPFAKSSWFDVLGAELAVTGVINSGPSGLASPGGLRIGNNDEGSSTVIT
jgi:hypothetical protein